MAQLSRPFQIALAAAVLFAGVLLFTLHGRSGSTSGAGSSAAVSTTAPATPAVRKPAHTASTARSSHSSTTHPTATGTHKPARASVHRAAATQTRTAKATPSKTHAAGAPAKAVGAPSKATVHKSASPSSTATLAGQHAVEADLAKGDVVVLLFWNPSGTDDAAVHRAVQAVKAVRHVAIQESAASRVASFGSVTRGVQVYSTPTVFVIGKAGKAIVLNGVQDAFSLEQAISEARSA